jgi:hypothetical protein
MSSIREMMPAGVTLTAPQRFIVSARQSLGCIRCSHVCSTRVCIFKLCGRRCRTVLLFSQVLPPPMSHHRRVQHPCQSQNGPRRMQSAECRNFLARECHGRNNSQGLLFPFSGSSPSIFQPRVGGGRPSPRAARSFGAPTFTAGSSCLSGD